MGDKRSWKKQAKEDAETEANKKYNNYLNLSHFKSIIEQLVFCVSKLFLTYNNPIDTDTKTNSTTNTTPTTRTTTIYLTYLNNLLNMQQAPNTTILVKVVAPSPTLQVFQYLTAATTNNITCTRATPPMMTLINSFCNIQEMLPQIHHHYFIKAPIWMITLYEKTSCGNKVSINSNNQSLDFLKYCRLPSCGDKDDIFVKDTLSSILLSLILLPTSSPLLVQEKPSLTLPKLLGLRLGLTIGSLLMQFVVVIFIISINDFIIHLRSLLISLLHICYSIRFTLIQLFCYLYLFITFTKTFSKNSLLKYSNNNDYPNQHCPCDFIKCFPGNVKYMPIEIQQQQYGFVDKFTTEVSCLTRRRCVAVLKFL